MLVGQVTGVKVVKTALVNRMAGRRKTRTRNRQRARIASRCVIMAFGNQPIINVFARKPFDVELDQWGRIKAPAQQTYQHQTHQPGKFLPVGDAVRGSDPRVTAIDEGRAAEEFSTILESS